MAQSAQKATGVRAIVAISIGIAALVAVYLLEGLRAIPSEIAPAVIYSVILLLLGLWLVNIVGQFTLRLLSPRAGNHAYTVRNLVEILGYAVLGIAVLSVLGVSPDVALAGGTVTGLVVGLGAQLVLSNFFAGLVILTTGFVKVGDEIRLLNSGIPYLGAQFPAYKYFSADYINVGYRGRVVEVGLMFSAMTTDTGLGLKVPNQIIFNSAIVDYRPAHSGTRILQVRYEFSIEYDPDAVLARVKTYLSDVKQINKIIFNEQSDKQYLIVLVEFVVPLADDYTILKSDILRRLAKAHRSFMQAGEPQGEGGPAEKSGSEVEGGRSGSPFR